LKQPESLIRRKLPLQLKPSQTGAEKIPQNDKHEMKNETGKDSYFSLA